MRFMRIIFIYFTRKKKRLQRTSLPHDAAIAAAGIEIAIAISINPAIVALSARTAAAATAAAAGTVATAGAVANVEAAKNRYYFLYVYCTHIG